MREPETYLLSKDLFYCHLHAYDVCGDLKPNLIYHFEEQGLLQMQGIREVWDEPYRSYGTIAYGNQQ